MALRERLNEEHDDLQQRLKQEAELATEKKAQEIREQIAPLKERRERVATLLGQLTSGYESHAAAAGELQAEHRRLQALFDQYHDVLGAKGIKSIKDFTTSSDYLNEPEIMQYHEKVAAVKTEHDTIKGAKAGLREQKLEVPENLKWKPDKGQQLSERDRFIEGVREQISELDKQIWDLHIQTPEGQAEKSEKEAFVKRVTDNLNYQRFEDLTDPHRPFVHDTHGMAEKYGKEYVQGVYQQVLDGKVEAMIKKPLMDITVKPLRTELDQIEATVRERRELYGQYRELLRTKEQITHELGQKLAQGKPLAEQLGARFRIDATNTYDIAAQVMKRLMENSAFHTYAWGNKGFDMLEEYFQRYEDTFEKLETRGRISGSMPPEIPLPAQLQEKRKYMEAMQEYLTAVKNKVGSAPAELLSDSGLDKIGMEVVKEHQQYSSGHLRPSEELQQLAQRDPLPTVNRRVDAMAQEIDYLAATDKEVLRAKLEYGLATDAKRHFEQSQSGIHAIISDGREVEKRQAEDQGIQKQLEQFTQMWEGREADQLGFIPDYRGVARVYTGKTFDRIQDLRNEWRNTVKRIKEIRETELPNKGRELANVSGWGKKGKRAAIDEQIATLKTEQASLEQAALDLDRQQNKLFEEGQVKGVAELVNTLGANENIANTKMTAGELITYLQNHFHLARQQPLPEQQQALYDQYRVLEEKEAAAKVQFEGLYKTGQEAHRRVDSNLTNLRDGRREFRDIKDLHTKQ